MSMLDLVYALYFLFIGLGCVLFIFIVPRYWPIITKLYAIAVIFVWILLIILIRY